MVSAPYDRKNEEKTQQKIAVWAVEAYISKSILPTYGRFLRARSHIYNWDETGLYFRLIPNATYSAQNEVRRRTRGTKAQKAKNRVTLITCTNVMVTHKIPLTMIGKVENPRCFRNKPCPLPYKAQKNVWNDYTSTARFTG